MFDLVTIPSAQRLAEAQAATPDYMHPNTLPWAVSIEGLLTDEQCDAITDKYNPVQPYSFRGCNAITRQCERPLDDVLEPVIQSAKIINDLYWNYDLWDEPAAWMQTYTTGCSYALHADAQPGQMRKLTAVAMLSSHYEGGGLWVRIEPKDHLISKIRGTVVVFPSWLPHFVDPVVQGKRQTINLGFWGPNFR